MVGAPAAPAPSWKAPRTVPEAVVATVAAEPAVDALAAGAPAALWASWEQAGWEAFVEAVAPSMLALSP